MAAWQKPENFALWLSIIIVLTTIIVSVMILFTKLYLTRLHQEQQKLQNTIAHHQKQLLYDNIKIQEQERSRIAADLHDGLISKLNVALMTLHTTQSIENTSSMMQKNIELARHISHDLSPPLLEESLLQELIEDFLHPLKHSHQIYFIVSQHFDIKLSSEVKLQIFRMTQEVVNNTLKHAKASQITLHLRFTKKYIALQIIDNGVGFEMNKLTKGLGFKNIALRSQTLQGQYRFCAQPHQGTSFVFYMQHSFL